MKKSLRKLMFAGMALVVSLGASAQTLENVWEHTEGIPGVSSSSSAIRDFTVLDGKILLLGDASNKIISIDAQGALGDFTTAMSSSPGKAISVDGAGNVIYSSAWWGNSAIKFAIIPKDGDLTTAKNIQLTYSVGANNRYLISMGSCVGDFMSEKGGYMFITRKEERYVEVIKIAQGAVVAGFPVSVPTEFENVNSGEEIVEPTAGITVDEIDALASKNYEGAFVMRHRSNGLYVWKDGALKQLSLSENGSTLNVNSNGNAGLATFKLQGKVYYVCPLSLDGKSRTTLFGVFGEDGKLVASTPAKEGIPTGLYYYQNFAVEPVDDNSVNIYYYHPGTVAAKYKFSVPEPAKLYAVGEFQGWNAVEPAEFTYADGKYTLTIGTTEAPVSSFKMSTTKNTEANDWNSGFNVGVICVADDKVVVPGEEFNLYVGGNADINFDWASVWTVTVDLENNTLSAEAATAKALYITGAGFEPAWDPANAIELTYNSDAKVYETPLTAANTEFKISTAKAGWDDGFNANAFNAGDVALTSTPTTLYKGNHPGNANIKVAAPADNTKLVVDLVNMTICVVADGTTGIEDVELESASVVYYNLQGVEVANDALVPGVYVKVQGAKATKVVVK